MSWWVYFIQAEDGPIKIGRARHPIDRLKGLQSANPVQLHLRAAFEGFARDENVLHKEFHPHRIRGEWFEPNEKLNELILRTGVPKRMKTLTE